MGAFEGKYSGLQVVGIYKEDLKKIDLIANPEKKIGDIDNFNVGISVGKGVANSLGIGIDQNLRLISPDGLKTLFGTTPRIGYFPVKLGIKPEIVIAPYQWSRFGNKYNRSHPTPFYLYSLQHSVLRNCIRKYAPPSKLHYAFPIMKLNRGIEQSSGPTASQQRLIFQLLLLF